MRSKHASMSASMTHSYFTVVPVKRTISVIASWARRPGRKP